MSAKDEQASPLSAPFTQTEEANEFQRILQKDFLPSQRESVFGTAEKLIEIAKARPSLIHEDSSETLQAVIADLDKRISQQLNKVLHHQEFQALEGSWRGLDHLVSNTESGAMLKLKVLDVSKAELGNALRAGAAWDQSAIFKKIYGEYDKPGAYPFGCMIGDYSFDNSPRDISILEGMAKIGAASHCPFIAAAAPRLLGLESWERVNDRRDIATIFQTPDYARWNSLRQSDDARFLGLTLPRFLARDPYSERTVHSEPGQFVFEEEVQGADHSKYLWANAAYAMGANIAKAFALYGW